MSLEQGLLRKIRKDIIADTLRLNSGNVEGDDNPNNPTNNFSATIDPTVEDDSSQGYSVGSRWINIISGDSFTCVDAGIGAAVWSLGGGGGGTLNDLSDCFTTTDSVVVGTADDITGQNIIALGKNIIPSIPDGNTKEDSVLMGYDIGENANTSLKSVVMGNLSVTSLPPPFPGHDIRTSCIIGIDNVSTGAITNEVVCIGSSNNIKNTNQILIGNNIDPSTNSNVFYISPGGMRPTSATTAMYYNNSTGEITQLTSSKRHKINIQDAIIDSSKLHNIIPKTYNRIGIEDTELGYIAEEMNELFPQFVSKDSKDLPYSINYELLVIPLIEEVKKLRKEVDELKNR